VRQQHIKSPGGDKLGDHIGSGHDFDHRRFCDR
jgi:hypothetical protein